MNYLLFDDVIVGLFSSLLDLLCEVGQEIWHICPLVKFISVYLYIPTAYLIFGLKDVHDGVQTLFYICTHIRLSTHIITCTDSNIFCD